MKKFATIFVFMSVLVMFAITYAESTKFHSWYCTNCKDWHQFKEPVDKYYMIENYPGPCFVHRGYMTYKMGQHNWVPSKNNN